METRTIPPAQASARQTELGDAFNRTLFSALDAVEELNLPYALIGGIAASGLGRPRSTHDIDFFVRPEDAEAVLEALGRHGFDIDRTDPRWLFKGWKDQMMVDIIFKSQGDIYFDSEMQDRVRPLHYHGRDIKMVSPEDLIIIKCAVHSEVGPHHWHDALAILSHATLDWHYLIKRSRRAPRRLLSLLVYAQSNDIWIPNWVITELFSSIFGGDEKSKQSTMRNTVSSPAAATSGASGAPMRPAGSPVSGGVISRPKSAIPPHNSIPEYMIGHILESLATDTRTAALDVQIAIGGRRILIKGDAATPEQKVAIEEVIRERHPDFEIDSQVRVTEVTSPDRVEDVV